MIKTISAGGGVKRLTTRGFSLIEALVSLLVLSFGMLAIASFQLNLFRSSDLAKQRTEATRLAQQKVEELRAFTRVETHTGTPHIVNYTDDVVSGTEVLASSAAQSNTDFTRTWTVTPFPAAGDTEKRVSVVVSWADRTSLTGQQHEVRLFSVIAKYDSRDLVSLSTTEPGSVTSQRRPKNRNINIPYPAVNVASCPSGSSACSAFVPPPGNVIYIFDNNTGNIIGSCTPVARVISTFSGTGTTATITTATAHSLSAGDQVTIAGAAAAFNGTFSVTSVVSATQFTYEVASAFASTTTGSGGTASRVIPLTEGMDLATEPGLGTCPSPMTAYLLSGYVRFDNHNNPTGEEPTTVGARHDTMPLDAATPLSLNASNNPSGYSGTAPAMTCYAQQQKVVTTNTTAITITSISRSGSTVTVTAASHGFVTGDMVAIYGEAGAVVAPTFVGSFRVTVTSASTFTYVLPPPVGPATSNTGGRAKKLERLTVPETTTVPGYTGVSARFVSYACVVTPVNHDGSSSTRDRWWGRVTLNAGSGWTIGSGATQFRICRYSSDYNTSGGAPSNSEHPLWYRAVTGALDSQNYLVIPGNRSCPTDVPQNLGSPFNAVDDTTILHQPTGTFSTNEPTTTSTDLLME